MTPIVCATCNGDLIFGIVGKVVEPLLASVIHAIEPRAIPAITSMNTVIQVFHGGRPVGEGDWADGSAPSFILLRVQAREWWLWISGHCIFDDCAGVRRCRTFGKPQAFARSGFFGSR